MGPGFGDAIAKSMVLGIIILAIGSAILGGLIVWGLPVLWTMIKPWLHQITG